MNGVAAHRKFSGRHELDPLDTVDGALGVGIEGPQGLDFIVE